MRQLDAWLLRLESILQSHSTHEMMPGLLGRSSDDLASMVSQQTEPQEETPAADRPSSSQPKRSTTSRHTQRSTRRASRVSYDDALEQAARVDFERSASQAALKPQSEQSEHSFLLSIQSRAQYVASSSRFDFFFLLVIISNSVLLGVQLEMSATSGSAGTDMGFLIANFVYAILFTTEIVVRIAAHGLKAYLCSRGWAWSWLDVTVVVSSWVELTAELATQSGGDGEASSNLRIIRIFRITRLLQTVRSLRLIRFLSALRTLVYSMVGAAKSLFWTLLLLGLVLYIFSILFTDVAVHYVKTQSGDSIQVAELTKHFGSVSQSMSTLYRSCLAGIDWHEPADSLLLWPQWNCFRCAAYLHPIMK